MVSVVLSLLLAPKAAPAPAAAQVSYTEPGFAGFDPNQKFRSVGIFGVFGKGTERHERDSYGLLTFGLKEDAPQSTLFWAGFNDGKDADIGHAVFPGEAGEKHFTFLDWTTGRFDFTTSDGGHAYRNHSYFSRVFPAALFETDAPAWQWKPGIFAFDRAAYRTASGAVAVVKPGETFGALGSPWVLLWNDSADGEIAPMLVRFEKRPTRLNLGDSLDAAFAGPAGSIVAMPLMGVRRATGALAAAWHAGPPTDAVREADFWTRASAAYPVATDETFSLDDAKRTVTIRDAYRYKEIRDAWGTKPLTLAPAPPVTALAAANGYPVQWRSELVRSPLATLLGPYAYVPGRQLTYTIPTPSARDNALAPVRVLNDPARQTDEAALNQLATSREIKPDDTSDGGLNLQLKEYSEGYRLLDKPAQATLAPQMARAFDASYAPENLQTVTDPVTGLDYVMCSKIWCAGEAYDREWYTGRQLDFTDQYGSWVDDAAPKDHWKAIQGLYAYFRIYNDWAWSGTLSSVYAYALCGDGMNFAMEGMLGTARMAKRYGDVELWKDASYRAAKQALCTYGSWFESDWMKSIDYVTWTDTSYDYEAKKGRYQVRRMNPADVQTGFGLDIYDLYSGIKVFRPGSFWHASAAVYWNNPSEDRLYAETLYPKIYRWEFETMPSLFPNWTDRDAIEKFSNQPFGSNMVLVHCDARTVLFGQAPDEMKALMTKLQPDIAFLYTLRARQDLIESGVPQIWAPTPQTSMTDAAWDADSHTLTASFQALSAGPATFDWTWRGVGGVSPTPNPGPKPVAVEIDGKRVPYQTVAGGFYRVTQPLKPGQTVALRVVYAKP